jgi:daunorubicin resistance ABC transporter membrane protein
LRSPALATISVLARRELLRFFRQRSRVFGAVAQPLLFWLVLGSGLIGYRAFLYPGVLVMVVLFTAVFTSMSVIEDRHSGFLQAVLASPAPRPALAFGKTLGGAAIALAQAALFVALMPLAGVAYGAVAWPSLILVLVLLAVGLTALGFAFAWWLDSTQGYHAVMMVLLMPAWVLSGAIFPLERAAPWMAAVMRGNPVTYGVDAVRAALAGAAPTGTTLTIVAAFAAAALAFAVWACSRRA